MLSTEQLELLTLEDLQAIGKEYGIQPLVGYNKREEWIRALSRFPYKAIDQMRDGVGISHPGAGAYDMLTMVLNLIGEPTDSQKALIRAAKMGDFVDDETQRFYQEKMLELYQNASVLREVIRRLYR